MVEPKGGYRTVLLPLNTPLKKSMTRLPAVFDLPLSQDLSDPSLMPEGAHIKKKLNANLACCHHEIACNVLRTFVV